MKILAYQIVEFPLAACLLWNHHVPEDDAQRDVEDGRFGEIRWVTVCSTIGEATWGTGSEDPLLVQVSSFEIIYEIYGWIVVYKCIYIYILYNYIHTYCLHYLFS